MTAGAGRVTAAGLGGGHGRLPRERLADMARSRPERPPGERYWIYGAGGFGRALAAAMARSGLLVSGFVDRRGRDSSRVDGLPCLHPEDCGEHDVAGSRLVHGILNHTIPAAAIMDWAEASPFAGLSFPAEFYAQPGFALSTYWLADPEETIAAFDELERLFDGLADSESRELLVAILAYRMTTDPRLHPALAPGEAYVPDFLDVAGEPIGFVDGGAFDGDTLAALMRSRITVGEWLAFEPDPGNFEALLATLDRYRDRLAAYTLIQAGLADRNGTLAFVASAGEASRLVEAGAGAVGEAVRVPVVSLDAVIRRPGPLYIKMDIEGAEISALHGMKSTLERRPTLAVSAYHRPSDLWEIPRLLGRLYPDPVLRLRQHGHHGFDTVLYVTPQ
jgi:FkbM family methyltransferase